MTTYDEDREWADKFLPHQAEIARLITRIEVAPFDEDVRRNTDLVLRTVEPVHNGEPIRISARVRRHEYLAKYRDEFTIRYRRPSGVRTEWHKMRAGDGDYFIYGFEAEPGSDRLGTWLIGNLHLLNDDYLAHGGYYRKQPNYDKSSDFAIFHLADMPLGFVLNSEGLAIWDREAPWQSCRRCLWGKWKGGYVMPTNDQRQAGDGYGRRCLACGFWWRSGWIAPLVRK